MSRPAAAPSAAAMSRALTRRGPSTLTMRGALDRMMQARQRAARERHRQHARPVLQMLGRAQQRQLRRNRFQSRLEIAEHARDAGVALEFRAVVGQRQQHVGRMRAERLHGDLDHVRHRRGRIGVARRHRTQHLHRMRTVERRGHRARIGEIRDRDIAAELREALAVARLAQHRTHGMAGRPQRRYRRPADMARCTEDHEHVSLLSREDAAIVGPRGARGAHERVIATGKDDDVGRGSPQRAARRRSRKPVGRRTERYRCGAFASNSSSPSRSPTSRNVVARPPDRAISMGVAPSTRFIQFAIWL